LFLLLRDIGLVGETENLVGGTENLVGLGSGGNWNLMGGNVSGEKLVVEIFFIFFI
jgi:hypothetical protein